MTTTQGVSHRFAQPHIRALSASEAAGYSAFAERLFRETYAEGYDPAFGARPLRRTIQRRILDALAVALLDGTLATSPIVRVTAHDDRIELVPTTEQASASRSSVQ